MKKLTQNKEYIHLLESIKTHIRRAQYDALKLVNKEMILLYWDIGRMIVERQAKQGQGKAVVETLAVYLQAEFPGVQGYSKDSLWRMRKFYLQYQNNQKLAPMVQEIGWAHNILIMEHCHDDIEREFYIHMTRKFGWTKDVLIHQIENKT